MPSHDAPRPERRSIQIVRSQPPCVEQSAESCAQPVQHAIKHCQVGSDTERDAPSEAQTSLSADKRAAQLFRHLHASTTAWTSGGFCTGSFPITSARLSRL